MNDFLYHLSAKVVGMFVAGLLLVLFLHHPVLAVAIFIGLIILLYVLCHIDNKERDRKEQQTRERLMEKWAEDAVARAELPKLRLKDRIPGDYA